MGFLDKLFGRKKDDGAEAAQATPAEETAPAAADDAGEHDHDHDHDHSHDHEH